MNERNTVIIAAMLATVLAAAAPASAMRDPIGHADGMNLYEYVHSAPTVGLDPSGLWDVRRENMSQATATAEQKPGYDTVAGLAQLIGLEESEFQQWLRLKNPEDTVRTSLGKRSLANLTSSDGICPGEEVLIPNIVMCVWAGDFGGPGKAWVQYEKDVQTLRDRGFYTFMIDVRGEDADTITAPIFEGLLKDFTHEPFLHGLFYWGHGVNAIHRRTFLDPFMLWKNPADGWVGLSLGGGIESQSLYARWSPEYKLGLGVLWACGSSNASRHFSDNGIFRGSDRVLVPHGFHLFGETMAKIIPPGVQGTRAE